MSLSFEQRKTLLEAINYRVLNFPRDTLANKLIAADEAFHMAKVDGGLATKTEIDSSNYSRFQELTNALVRETVETYYASYVTTYLSSTTIFGMTSPADRAEDAEKFNTIMADQQRRAAWGGNLAKAFLDIAKYNLALVDHSWDHQVNYGMASSLSSLADQNTSNVKRTEQVWAGNHITHCDMYNSFFDHSVDPVDLNTKGEWGGWVDLYTQVRFKELVDKLKTRNGDLYLTDPNDPKFNIYGITKTSSAQQVNGASFKGTGDMSYREPVLSAIGQEKGQFTKDQTNWAAHTSGLTGTPRVEPSAMYEITKIRLRVVPSAWGLGQKGDNDAIAIYEVYIVAGTWVLYTEKLENIHDRLGFILCQTDQDSLGYNTTGPAQVSIPYMKTAKQLLDRVLAGADRAISDRAIYDSTMFSQDDVSSKIPDAKIATSKKLPNGKRLADYYHSIPYDNSATRGLLAELPTVEAAGKRASGLNNPQTGQFQKGNKTLYEYQDTMQNSGDRTFIRTLNIENTMMAELKWMTKLNIIQWQKQATLFNEENQVEVDINPAKLFDATVEFVMADGLLPTEYQLSPNVQQQVIQLITQAPELFAEYDVPGIVQHIIGQTSGVKLDQYKQGSGTGATTPPTGETTGIPTV